MAADKSKVAPTREKVTCELTKTKAKKCVMVAFKEETDRKEALRQIKKNYPSAGTSKLANGVLVELSSPKEAKEAKETFGKVFKDRSAISVQTALATKKKVESTIRHQTTANSEMFAPVVAQRDLKSDNPVPLSGQMGDRSRGLFEIRIPKIIIRNLNFNVKEAQLKAEMEKFGSVSLINLPKKADGKPKGFGFVVFDKLNDAKKAIDTLNGRIEKFLGTKVACDWCIPKNIFVKNTAESEQPEKVTSGDEGNSSDEEKESNQSGSDSEGCEDEDKEESEEPKKAAVKRKATDSADKLPDKFAKKREAGTKDVQEQRTVFIRNLSYDTSAEAVQEALTFFGPIQYVKICMDKDLERPKGTAFVCFEKSQDAVNACSESDMFEVDGRKIQIDMAVSRTKVYDIIQDRKSAESEPQDNRNLALAKEGIIYPNSYEAKDVSKADMIRRQKLEESNKLKLQILHYFVSPTRLSVHNLPIKCSDDELRKIFQDAIDEGSGRVNADNTFKKSGITECRIMRDMSRVNSEGVHRSKGFGFVEFTTTALAKKALHAVNNNGALFKNGQRPIVQFSIEDMRALKKKQERYEKAQVEFKKKANGLKKPSGGKAGFKSDKGLKKSENKRFNLAPREEKAKEKKTRPTKKAFDKSKGKFKKNKKAAALAESKK